MKFYTKKTESVLDLLGNETKLKMNWDLVKRGADVNEVFKKNPVGLDAFLVNNSKTKSANDTKDIGYDDDLAGW